MTRPIALTCGEPAGVGLELTARAHGSLKGELAFFLIADPGHVRDAGGRPIEIARPSEAGAAMLEGIPVIAHRFPGARRPGALDPSHARGVIESIERAVVYALDGQACAVCTNPIHKKGLQEGAGFGFSGHTDFLGHISGAERPVMMLASESLRVVPVTVHLSLKDAVSSLTSDLVESAIRVTSASLSRWFGVSGPRLAVSGLNPHAGEGGLFGNEEMEIIGPAIARARAMGISAAGPLPADTMFHERARKAYDAAICMYHDQALIPVKTLAFDSAVNVTLGLPFIRTSPDHGTALDIAGRGVARAESLVESLRLAWRMSRAFQDDG